MGISADIIQVKEKIENINDLMNIDPENFKNIAYIGTSYNFNKNVLENYEANNGFFKIKDGWNYINKETQDILKRYLEDKYNIELKYLLEKDNWFITLNY